MKNGSGKIALWFLIFEVVFWRSVYNISNTISQVIYYNNPEYLLVPVNFLGLLLAPIGIVLAWYSFRRFVEEFGSLILGGDIP